MPRHSSNTYIGSVWISHDQCSYNDCDSWKTVGLQVVAHDDGRAVEMLYSLCQRHLFEFIDRNIIHGENNIVVSMDELESED